MPSPVLARRLITPFRSKLLAEYAVNGFFGGITTSRATALWLPNASGTLVEYTSGNVGVVDGDAVWCQPGATNLVTHSHEFDNAAWTKTRSSIGVNATTGPDGNSTADKLIEDSSSSASHFCYNAITSLTSGQNYCFSVFAKAAERTEIRMAPINGANGARCTFNLSAGTYSDLTDVGTGTGVAAGITSFENGWYRCWIVVNTATTSYDANIFLSVGGLAGYNGDGSSGAYLFGAQFELGSHPTAYIPTSGSTDTAGPTEPIISWPTGLTDNFVLEATVNFQVDPGVLGNVRVFETEAYATNGAILFYNAGANTWNWRVYNSGNTNETFILDTNPTVGSDVTIKCVCRGGESFFYIDSTKSNVDSSGVVGIGSKSNLQLGWGQVSGVELLAKIKNVKFHKVSPAITDAEILAL